MKFNIHGKKVDITPAIENYIKEKIGRLDKYFQNPEEVTATVMAKIYGKKQIVEVTINAYKMILRGEEAHQDLYAAIDLVSDKIERQIRKNKTKLHKHNTRVNYKEFNMDYDVEEGEIEENKIVKRKTIDTKPMNEEEAILQMELLGHDFFAFRNTDNNISIVYKRKDKDYGIIETK